MLEYTTDPLDGTAPEVGQTLDELAREGARRMIEAALQLELLNASTDCVANAMSEVMRWWCATGEPESGRRVWHWPSSWRWLPRATGAR